LFVLFQPAEESLGGAKKIIETEVLKDVQYLIATHLRPIEELPLGKVTPAILHGASTVMEMEIIGEDAHGARPHQGVNAIEAAAGIIQAIQALHLDPTVPHSAKVTKIQSGPNPSNVIPSSVVMGFDLRAQTNELMAIQRGRIAQIAADTAKAYGARAVCKTHPGVPAATRCPELIETVTEAIKEALGEKFVAPPLPTPGGEDFHEYAVAMPGLKSTVVGIGADLTPGLHKAEMTFHLDALLNGAKVLAAAASHLLKPSS
jgi:amidohydrolase